MYNTRRDRHFYRAYNKPNYNSFSRYYPRFKKGGCSCKKIGYTRKYGKMFPNKGLADETFDKVDGIVPGEVMMDYFQLLKVGQGPNDRCGRSVKIYSINIDGVITFEGKCIRLGRDGHEMLMDDTDGPYRPGYGVLFVVLDREPSSAAKPKFEEVFGVPDGSHKSRCFPHVRVDVLVGSESL